VRLLLHANVLQLKSNATGARVEKLRVATLEGKEFTVRARFIALAAGGIEVTRLLLLSNDANPAGLGNEHDLVGRFYGSHVSGDLGEVALTPRAAGAIWTYEQGRDGVYCKRHLRISEETQRRVGLLNYRCTLTHPPFGDPSHRSAVLSAAYLVKRFLTHQIPPEFSKDMASREYHHVRQHVRNVILGSPSLAGFGLHWFFKRTIATRKYPSVSLRSKANRYTIHFDAEQAPNRESRIILGDDTDRFGLRRVRVLWKTSDLDSHSVGECHRILAKEFERTGTGKVELPHTEAARIIRDESGVGSHHIGSTRMADDPKQGVVDRNARVHSVENLFIAAPSIFCTASFANPVLTTAAFAVRLGDHIKATCR
jgi:choline dehydrogenase-like flavoprotein